MDNEKLNSSGCLDKTAFEAIKNVRVRGTQKLIAEIKSLPQDTAMKLTAV